VDAAKWLKAQSWVDPDRVGVWGWSNGGYITLTLMTRSDVFKAGIAVAPVTDWRFYDSRWAEAFLGMPQQNPQAYDDASPIPRAGALHGRLLIVYGSYDDNVHPQNELAFIDALVKAPAHLFQKVRGQRRRQPARVWSRRDRPDQRHILDHVAIVPENGPSRRPSAYSTVDG